MPHANSTAMPGASAQSGPAVAGRPSAAPGGVAAVRHARIVPDQTPTSPDDALRAYLAATVAARPAPPSGYRYRGVADLVLDAGVPMRVRRDPHGRRGERNLCFKNSLVRALEDPDRYVYCEGFAAGRVIPLLHAWVFDRDLGLAFETTWEEPGSAYLGIGFDTVWADAQTTARGYHGLLDDWTRRWPLLRGLPAGAVAELATAASA